MDSIVLKRHLGSRLCILRKHFNLTQEQMSMKLNVSTSAYCKIEYGETDLTITRIKDISEVFNMSLPAILNFLINDLTIGEYVLNHSRFQEVLDRNTRTLEIINNFLSNQIYNKNE